SVAPITATLPSDFKNRAGEGFASFRLPVVQQEAKIQQNTVPADLKGVQIPVLLSPAQRSRLAKDGVVVSPGTALEFYELYEKARYDYLPEFITSDSLLHTYHLAFDGVLRRTERKILVPALA